MIAFRRPSLGGDQSGTSAIEFALILPIMLTIFFSGYVYSETVSVNRKVTITARAIADLTSQYSAMVTTDMTTVLGASTQIIAPFDATPLSIRVSEIYVDPTVIQDPLSPKGKATVVWSRGQNASGQNAGYQIGSTYALPKTMAISGYYYILSETYYTYTPPALYKIIQPITLSDSILMLPRLSRNVTYNGS